MKCESPDSRPGTRLKPAYATPRRSRLSPRFIGWALVAIALAAGCSSDGSGQAPSTKRIPLPDMGPATPYVLLKESNVAIERDDPGKTRLRANIFRPDAEGTFPTLLESVAYRREIFQIAPAPDVKWLASQGYAVIQVDARGTGSSEGEWGSFSEDEIQDILWIVDNWIPEQPWSNGKVGLFGPSYMGINQLLAAGKRPTHLKAIFPGVPTSDVYRDVFYQGGIFDQEFIYFWAFATAGMSILPGTQLATDPFSALKAFSQHLTHIPQMLSWLDMTTDQEFFSLRSPMTYWKELADMPILTTAGWFCIFTRGGLLNHTYLTREVEKLAAQGKTPVAPKRMIVGPWYHANGAILQGLPSKELHKRWFDWHLKADDDPLYARYDILDPRYPVNIFVMGAEQWRKEMEWPLERARSVEFLLSGDKQTADRNESLNNGALLLPGEASLLGGTGQGPSITRISHAPPDFAGEKSRSSARWLAGMLGIFPYAEDERQNESKTLTFSTPRLDSEVEVTGPSILRLWARTHFEDPPPGSSRIFADLGGRMGVDLTPMLATALQKDVHWIVNLDDVYPDGRVRNLTSGWLAASHRRDPSRPTWLQPGYDPFAYPEDTTPTPAEDGALYEYVIEIWPTSNLFRAGHQIRIDIVNSDVPHLLPSLVPSESEIVHDEEHPSRLILPVVDSESTPANRWIQDAGAYFRGEEPWDDS